MKSLSRISLTIFLGMFIWMSVVYNDNKLSTVTWENVQTNTAIPNNKPVKMPKGTGVHPLALVSETKDGKLSVYQYIYLPDTEVEAWKSAIAAYQAGDQQPVVDLGKASTQVVIVDTMRYNGKPKAQTPENFEIETDVVGFCHRGFEYLKAKKTEFQSLYGHLSKENVVVLVENPAIRPSEAFPIPQAAGAALALIAALAFASMSRKPQD